MSRNVQIIVILDDQVSFIYAIHKKLAKLAGSTPYFHLSFHLSFHLFHQNKKYKAQNTKNLTDEYNILSSRISDDLE